MAATTTDTTTGCTTVPTTSGGVSGDRVGRGAVYPSRRTRRASRLLLPIAAILTACVTVPISGRSAFYAFPAEQDIPLGAEAYTEILADEKPISTGPQVAMVEKIMQRLVAVTGDLQPAEFEWEVTLLDAPDVPNAFCLPGGKMAVYTGILPITQDETGLAVVMGHEIGHALARHGAERMSQELVKSGLLEAVVTTKPDWKGYAELGYLGSGLVTLAWGRDQELEADHMGLIIMARAGYDPREAVEFWQRMQQMAGGGGTIEWLSTHPSNQNRIDRLKELMPEALAIYQGS